MSGKTRTVSINGEVFSAYVGDVLLDAALVNGVDVPHDCRAGQCGSCVVRVLDGRVYGGETGEPGTIKACQARVVSDLKVVVEDVPEVSTVAGRVTAMRPLADDIVEVAIEPSKEMEYLPGQYMQVQFRGFPARCFSPTVPMDAPDDGSLRFHIRRVPDGRVTSALGESIREGHRLKLTGPLGSAYLRPDLSNRLILVASGTGFAPIWSIAEAALAEAPRRKIVIAVGARSLESLYMIPALCKLAEYRNVIVVPVTTAPQSMTDVIQSGRPTDHLPKLSPQDVVYAAGAPNMVKTVEKMARAAGAVFYADPFVAGPHDKTARPAKPAAQPDPVPPPRAEPLRLAYGNQSLAAR